MAIEAPRRSKHPRAGSVLAALAAAWAAWHPVQALAAYQLRPGDVIEISVAGVPDLRQRSTVNPDGEVSFQLLGEMKVVGSTLAEVRAKIQELLPTKVYRQRSPDGRENLILMRSDEVTVNVAEYRPVYLNGDVSKPGEQVYRPGMTVRQAVALAGGYDIYRFRIGNPFLEMSDLQSSYSVLWTEYVKAQAEVWRLRSELDGRADPKKDWLAAPIPKEVATQIASLEAEQLKAREADVQKEKAFLQRVIKQSDTRLALLTEQQQKEDEGTQSDASDFDRVRALFEKGTIPITRVTDARRAVLLSSTRSLQTGAQRAQLQREREELGRKLQKIDDQRRMDLLRELEEANVKLETTRSRVQAVTEKMAYTGALRSQLVGGSARRPEIRIFRGGAQGQEPVVATEDTELLPGDVIEIALQSENILGAPTR